LNDLERLALGVLAERAQAWFTNTADTAWADDWQSLDAFRRYVATLRSGKTWVGCCGSVFARVTGDFGYVAMYALDNLNIPGDDPWMIDEIRPNVYRLKRIPVLPVTGQVDKFTLKLVPGSRWVVIPPVPAGTEIRIREYDRFTVYAEDGEYGELASCIEEALAQFRARHPGLFVSAVVNDGMRPGLVPDQR
jgi:hypothetical protein